MEQQKKSSHTLPDWSYGEPLVPQHVVIDFTPSKETDTEFIQKKCCKFWDFVNKSPELKGLMVFPELVQFDSSEKDTSMIPESFSTKSTKPPEKISQEQTAVSVLEYAMKKGVTGVSPSQMVASGAVESTLVQRLPTTCSLGLLEYQDGGPNNAARWTTPAELEISSSAARNKGSLKTTKGTDPKSRARSLADAKLLCETMRDWDCSHPKSMKPPGPVPLLSHSVMQRKVTTRFSDL